MNTANLIGRDQLSLMTKRFFYSFLLLLSDAFWDWNDQSTTDVLLVWQSTFPRDFFGRRFCLSSGGERDLSKVEVQCCGCLRFCHQECLTVPTGSASIQEKSSNESLFRLDRCFHLWPTINSYVKIVQRRKPTNNSSREPPVGVWSNNNKNSSADLYVLAFNQLCTTALANLTQQSATQTFFSRDRVGAFMFSPIAGMII